MSKTVWFTSDTHFQHDNVIAYCGRPFANVREMNEQLVRRWNAVVAPDDIVYHLGDFAMGDRTRIPDLLTSLHGKLILVAGNHDFARDDRYFPKVLRGRSFPVSLDGLRLELAHNPIHLTGLGVDLALCGHVHTDWKVCPEDKPTAGGRHGPRPGEVSFVAPCTIVNVGVDVWGFAPVSLDEIMKCGAGALGADAVTTPEATSSAGFRVWLAGEYPKPRRRWHKGTFATRQLARGFCRNRAHEGTWWIVHPNGTEEMYRSAP